jgi:hypothetical protein
MIIVFIAYSLSSPVMLMICLLQLKHGLYQQVKVLVGYDVSDEESRRRKINFGHRSTQRWKNGKLWLSLMMFSMNFVKLVNIPLAFHCNISSILCPHSKEENDYMSHVQCNRKVDDCDGMFNYFTWSWCCEWTHGKTK